KCIQVTSPGPRAFLLVLQVGRFTEEEQNCIQALQKLFGPEASRHMIVLFTRGDELGGATIQEHVSSGHPTLQELVRRCGGRYHVFNNKKICKRRQVVHLIKMIDNIVASNGGKHFSDEMFEAAEKEITTLNLDRNVSKGKPHNFVFMRELFERIVEFQHILAQTLSQAPSNLRSGKAVTNPLAPTHRKLSV
ncbi:GTPase IMAP family member 7-like, partial [Corythoichthys intestinalis]|uniref:GTPase IMAP family member 7-like n=1 Tax=Corythoichthys intestinalis TaxID=161448 RepID=UPI0025A6088E